MAGPVLFARCRGTTVALVALAALALVGLVLGDAALRLDEQSTFSVPWAVVVPMFGGAVVGLTVRSPLGWLEVGSPKPVALLRAAHLSAMLITAGVAALIGSWGLSGPLTEPGALRNLLGFAGLAYLAAATTTGGLAWVLPVAFATVALSAGTSEGRPRGWAWPLQPDGDVGSWVQALATLCLGFVLLSLNRTREPDTEEH